MKKTKKLGRPKAKALLVPAWAIKRIEELAKSSGVSPERTLESALKMGLYAVAEQYGGLIQFQASADKLFFGEPELADPGADQQYEPLPVTRNPEEAPEPEPEQLVQVEYEQGSNAKVERLAEPELEEATENGSFASALQ